MKTALILYPHQLYPLANLPNVDTVILVEEPLYFGVDLEFPKKLHKQKLVLHRASMQRYAKEILWPAKIDVQYVELDVLMKTGDIFDLAKGVERLLVFDPVDDVLTRRLLVARRENEYGMALEFLPSPNFYLKDEEVRGYFDSKSTHCFADFYQWQRERFNILIGGDFKPVGGKWSFDEDKDKKPPRDRQLPTFTVFGDNEFVRDSIKWVLKHFPDNPGELDFIWPTNHVEAAGWLQNFVEHRLDNFGAYEDAIDGQAAWLYHSALSSSINTGLLSPGQIIEAVLKRHHKRPIPLASLEGFVRQIIGWREYMRGMYVMKHTAMRAANPLKHNRKMTSAWYSGSLGLPPFDDMVKKVQHHAYAHNIERLMVAGNLMTLCEIQPDQIYRWFSELFIDAYDWAMVPNVFGINQFADGANMVTKPYISASDYILTMSNYQPGEWCNVWDGLYWRFIEKHETELLRNPFMSAMAQKLASLDTDQKRIINYRAEDFLSKFTR
ncbi:MAG: cryptochrome/photolyase family protein [Candidatus Saccharimonadales bacterium]